MQLNSIFHYSLTSCQRSSIFKTPDPRFFHSDFLSKSLYKCDMILWISSELMKESVFSHNVKKSHTDSKLPLRWKLFLIQWNFLCQQLRDLTCSVTTTTMKMFSLMKCVWWVSVNRKCDVVSWWTDSLCPHVSTWDWWRCCWFFHLFCMMGPNIRKRNSSLLCFWNAWKLWKQHGWQSWDKKWCKIRNILINSNQCPRGDKKKAGVSTAT